MNFEDIPAFKDIESRIIIPNVSAQSSILGQYVEILLGSDGEFLIKSGSEVFCFDFLDMSAKDKAECYLGKGFARLAQIIPISGDEFFIRIKFFAHPLSDGFKINVLMGDEMMEIFTRQRNSSKMHENVKKYFLIDGLGNEDEYFLVYKGAADGAGDDIGGSTAFTLYSPQYSVSVEVKKETDLLEKSFCEAIRVVGSKNKFDKNLYLVKGGIDFSSKKEYLSAYAEKKLSSITAENDSYFKAWDRYGEEEGILLLDMAKEIGVLHFDGIEPADEPEILRFFIKGEIPKILKCMGDFSKITLELASEPPLYVEKPNISWKEFADGILINAEAENNGKKSNSKKAKESLTINSIGENYIEVKCSLGHKDIDKDKYFFTMSFAGEKAQIERRNKARRNVLMGKSANPQLGLIIEGSSEILEARKPSKTIIKAVSPYVREKIFPKNAPTPTQEKAIEIALNTPDIALIQGPPGTGKTTVINAIIERLNEIKPKTDAQSGAVLLSAFQHCAVENVKSRVKVNGLPTVKFGGKEKNDALDESGWNNDLEAYIESIRGKIKERYPSLAKGKELLDVEKEYISYVLSPSREKALRLIDKLLDNPAVALNRACASSLRGLHEGLKIRNSKPYADVDEESAALVREIRISEQGFKDDGPAILEKILEVFGGTLLSADDKKSIEHILKTNKFDGDYIRGLKERLFDSVLPDPVFNTEKPKENILAAIKAAMCAVKDSFSAEDKLESVLSEYLSELEGNIFGVRDSLKELTFVYASTVQQCEGREILNAKGKDRPNYDTVIVDEAARTSPRDLLIPMAKAEKRIILVGDQRQLPHIIDDSILVRIDRIDNGDAQDKVDIAGDIRAKIKDSMFGYLFNKLKILEKSDGIQRTITLDTQYRMHPLLGKFVSDNFYKQYGEDFKSDLAPEYFRHNIECLGDASAVWINVPLAAGECKRFGTSWTRTPESECIVRYLKELMEGSDDKLTFGVITFYKAQADKIESEIKKLGIYEKVKDRVTIGTVDSFQGMEFDVVFLSMVRSRKIHKKSSALSLFGHLMMENRLCVAMSRQKKLLIMVGDKDFATSRIARESIPAVSNFYDICASKGKVLNV